MPWYMNKHTRDTHTHTQRENKISSFKKCLSYWKKDDMILFSNYTGMGVLDFSHKQT